MANRRFGGGPQRGGRGFSQNANVNPWQGNSGPAINALGNPNLQTQIALALTSLLQPQQPNDPPSLLSLNTSPGNFNQDNFSNRIGHRGRDFRRNEPYNKNQRSGWRHDRGQNRGPVSSRNRSNKDKSITPSSRDKFKSNKKSSDKTSDDSQKSNKDKEIKDEKQGDSIDETRDEESSETKRDWKDEKNAGAEKDNQDKDGKEEGSEKAKKDNSKYGGLPNSLFHCFVCNKSMWDGDSFQNHIRGKAHVQMLDSLEESFQITVKILRENMRLAEEKKMIEWNRMQRNNRKFHSRNEPQSHCNMCDLKFMGKIIGHRKTEGHQRLKRFLHPNCNSCNLEFPSRMEWVDHRFTPEHLFKMKEILETRSGDDTEGHIVEEEVEWDNDPILQESLQCEDENPVLELDDDLANLYNRVPMYLATRPVGKNSVKALEGFFCEICKKFLRSETDSQNHLKSEKHYHEFVSAVKAKFRAKVEKEEQEGSWKKQKAEAEKAEQDAEDAKEEPKTAEDGNDMYDPEEACKDGVDSDDIVVEENTEATVEDGDVEMKEEVEEIKEEATEPEEPPPASDTKTTTQTTTVVTRRRTSAMNGSGAPVSKIRKN